MSKSSLPGTHSDANDPWIAGRTYDQSGIACLNGHILDIVFIEQIAGKNRQFHARAKSDTNTPIHHGVALDYGVGRSRRIAKDSRSRV